MPTTPLSRCSVPGKEGPGRGGCGRMSETTGLRPVRTPQRWCIATLRIGRPSERTLTSRRSAASCRPTPTVALHRCTRMGACAKRPAGRMRGASTTTCTPWIARRTPRRLWSASLNSTQSSGRSAARPLRPERRCVALGRPRSWRHCELGSQARTAHCRPSPRSPAPSNTR